MAKTVSRRPPTVCFSESAQSAEVKICLLDFWRLQLQPRLTTVIVQAMHSSPGWATSTRFLRPSRRLPRLQRAMRPRQQQRVIQVMQLRLYECMRAVRRVLRAA
jgi:hypothetical protein